MKNLLLLLMFITFCYRSYSQVELVTKYGTVEGYIVKETDSSITLKEYSGTKYRILLDDIQSKNELYSKIVFNSDSSFVAHIYKVDSNIICYRCNTWSDSCIKLVDIREYGPFNIKSISYSSLGFTYGYPGGLNAFYGYQTKEIVNLKLELGFVGKIFGLETDLGFNLYRDNIFETNIALGFGIMFEAYGENSSSDPFIALKYNLSLYGIFGELGYCLFQSNRLDGIYYQIGYVFRLF
jgi:hypothetical protein